MRRTPSLFLIDYLARSFLAGRNASSVYMHTPILSEWLAAGGRVLISHSGNTSCPG